MVSTLLENEIAFNNECEIRNSEQIVQAVAIMLKDTIFSKILILGVLKY